MAECILMRKALPLAYAPVHWPPGIELRPWNAGRAQAVLALLLSVQQLEAGTQVVSWLQQLAHDAEFDPRLCRLAYDQHGLVGFAMGWTSSFIRHLVVRTDARQQGLGTALLHDLLNVYRYRDEGFVDLTLLADNTDALRLYAKAGMIEVRRYTP
ncbi:GCN5-like N-acetyltransferase [Pseudomonas sp. M47T1]|uniref:GNAT family N-acetyltransferase n=1 Tax=unclassified Pseudomonas TaxID=196821 RepID=UPI0002607806|nr:GNAT family N-acetyltransferase [Pseudomonas sp. M47T1]EIK97648.1 GCN5-like N-acetyltransferase [Pseudomonas sp. M47T1]